MQIPYPLTAERHRIVEQPPEFFRHLQRKYPELDLVFYRHAAWGTFVVARMLPERPGWIEDIFVLPTDRDPPFLLSKEAKWIDSLVREGEFHRRLTPHAVQSEENAARRAERRRDLDDEAERVFAKNIMYEKVVKDGGGPAWNDVKRYRQRRWGSGRRLLRPAPSPVESGAGSMFRDKAPESGLGGD